MRLLVRVSGPVTENIMVFGQAPCSAGRSKRRNVAYLGLLPAPKDGLSDITDLYVARYGEPRPGMKVFIVTRQQKDGWEGDALETSGIVPENPAGQQAAATPTLTLIPYMYKGCTTDAHQTIAPPIPGSQWDAKPGKPGGEAAKPASRGSEAPGGGADAPGQGGFPPPTRAEDRQVGGLRGRFCGRRGGVLPA